MLSLKLVMTQSEPATTMVTMSTPNASASTLFVLSGSGGDVQKEHKVDTHLRDGEHREAERDAGRPEQRSVGDPEGDGREDYGHLEQARSCTHPRERNGNRCGLHGQLLRALRRLILQNEWLVAAISHDHLSFLIKTPSQFRR